MTGPFDDGLDPMELAMFLAISEELSVVSEEEKLLAAQESELQDEDDPADAGDREEEEDSRPMRAKDIF